MSKFDFNDEPDELEFDDDSDTANAEYIATNDQPYYPDEVGI